MTLRMTLMMTHTTPTRIRSVPTCYLATYHYKTRYYLLVLHVVTFLDVPLDTSRVAIGQVTDVVVGLSAGTRREATRVQDIIMSVVLKLPRCLKSYYMMLCL